MTHFNEQTIELYLLGSDRVAEQREQIRLHLEECASCSELHDELADFYKAAHGSQPLLGEQTENVQDSSVVVRPEYRSVQPAVPIPRSVPAKILQFAGRHPGTTAISGLAAALVLGFLVTRLPEKTDRQPAIVSINVQEKMFELRNRSGEKLWSAYLAAADDFYDTEQKNRVNLSVVADIDGDGESELVTVLPLDQQEEHPDHMELKIYDNEKKIRVRQGLDRVVSIGKRVYASKLDISAVEVIAANAEGEKEIIAVLTSENSPCVLFRIDAKGTVIGEYWHYGHLRGFLKTDLNGDGHPELLLAGMNDTTNTSALVVLDPSKIEGKTQSSAGPDFGFARSTAEMWYLSAPPASMEADYVRRGKFAAIKLLADQSLAVEYLYVDSGLYRSYTFDKNLKLTQIQPADLMIQQFRKFYGRPIYNEFLDSLKSATRYWDGTAWVKSPTAVRSE